MSAEREDFLTEDMEIPGQKYCLLSFLSPEKVLANKDVYFFSKFLETFEYTQRVSSFESFLMSTIKYVNDKISSEADKAENYDLSGVAQTLRSSRVQMDTLMDSFQKYVKDAAGELKESKLKTLYEDFLFTNREKLEESFYIKNEFRTSVRGLKIRGVYSSNEEAVARSKKLQRNDTLHNIFVGEVGKWLPWDPSPSDVADQEYAEEKLNTLMKKYKENEDARETYEREKRSNMTGSGKPRVGPTSLVNSVEGVETEVKDSSGTDYDNIESKYKSMFGDSGPADLAMARKMGGNLD
jgi:hypothetical protein